MKKISRGLFTLLLLAAAVCCFQPAGAKEEGFSLVNHTGADITKVYVAPHGEKDWSHAAELLHGHTLKQGQHQDVSFHHASGMFDLRAEDAAGHHHDFTNLDLSKASEVTLDAGTVAHVK